MLGFLISPLVPAFLLSFVVSAQTDGFAGVHVGIIIYAFFSYLFVFLLGIPSYFLVTIYMKKITLVRILPIGAILGTCAGIVLPLLLGVDLSQWLHDFLTFNFLRIVLIFTSLGMITTWIFWLLAMWQRDEYLLK